MEEPPPDLSLGSLRLALPQLAAAIVLATTCTLATACAPAPNPPPSVDGSQQQPGARSPQEQPSEEPPAPEAQATWAGEPLRLGPDPPPATTPRTLPPPEVAALLDEISRPRLFESVSHLAAFETRHTLSATDAPTRGIGAARRWLREAFEAAVEGGAPQVEVSEQRHELRPGVPWLPQQLEVVDLVVEIPGSMPEARDRRYVVAAHYDSRAEDVLDGEAKAPGADDNASGVAVLLELARALSHHPLDATVVLLATAGEEQGYLGAEAYAQAAHDAGLDPRAVLNIDTVGDPTSPFGEPYPKLVRVFSEGLPKSPGQAERLRRAAAESDSPSRQLARFVAETAAWQGTHARPFLVWRSDRPGRGGDHFPFNDLGVPAVLFTEAEDRPERQHRAPRRQGETEYGDRVENVDAAYLASVARLAAAVVAHLGNAPSSPPRVSLLSGSRAGAFLSWSASPEPDTAGYEVMWRRTTTALWEHAWDVGPARSASLPVSPDHHLFGVRAYDQQGYRSPATFAEPASDEADPLYSEPEYPAR